MQVFEEKITRGVLFFWNFHQRGCFFFKFSPRGSVFYQNFPKNFKFCWIIKSCSPPSWRQRQPKPKFLDFFPGGGVHFFNFSKFSNFPNFSNVSNVSKVFKILNFFPIFQNVSKITRGGHFFEIFTRGGAFFSNFQFCILFYRKTHQIAPDPTNLSTSTVLLTA